MKQSMARSDRFKDGTKLLFKIFSLLFQGLHTLQLGFGIDEE